MLLCGIFSEKLFPEVPVRLFKLPFRHLSSNLIYDSKYSTFLEKIFKKSDQGEDYLQLKIFMFTGSYVQNTLHCVLFSIIYNLDLVEFKK